MKEAMQRFVAYAMGSASKEHLLCGLVEYGCVSTVLMKIALLRFARVP